jgi:type VI secretion system protein ImpM
VTAGAAPPGWHGKLPSLGDFVSRRLDAAFIEPWDAWLAAGLLSLRQTQPDTWLDAYLGSPSWRFLLMPGVLPLGAGPASVQEGAALWPWLERLDELARDALHGDWTAERLEDELARMALPAMSVPPPEADVARSGVLAELPADAARDPARAIGIEAQRAFGPHAHGRAWWHARPDEGPPRLLVSRGLPATTALGRLFGPAATI